MKRQPAKLRTAINADRICELLSQGWSLRQVARELGCDASAIAHWVREDQDARGAFSQRYARAREVGLEMLADELVELADTPCLIDGRPDNALVQQLRVQIDTRKWLLSKMLPRQFGDKVTQELVGDPNAPIVTRIELVPVAPMSREPGDEVNGSRQKLTIATSR